MSTLQKTLYLIVGIVAISLIVFVGYGLATDYPGTAIYACCKR